MYHSINFGDANTYDDWLIVPSSRPVFSPPSQKTQVLDIPGANGSLDISTSLTGYPVYENRTGSTEFLVLNDYAGYDWSMVYSTIMSYLHGKTMKAVLEDDPGYYYQGRYTVNQWKSEKDWSRITIDYDVNPFKWELMNSLDEWLWDPFNFRTGVIYSKLFKDIEKEKDGIENFLIQNIDTDKFLELVRAFANPYALVDSKYAENIGDPKAVSSYAVSMALNKVQLGKQGNKEVDPNYLWKAICEKHPDLVRVLYSPEVRDGVLGIFRELLQGCAKAHDEAARALVSNNPNIFQYNVGFAENAEYLKNQNKIDAEEAEKAELNKHKKADAYHAYKMAFNSQTKYAKDFYDLAGNDDAVLNCKDPGMKLSAMLTTPDNPLVGLNAEETTALLKETLDNLENASDDVKKDAALMLRQMQVEFNKLGYELLDKADSLLNDPSVSKINMYDTMDKVLSTGAHLNTSKGKLFISAPVFLHAIHGMGLASKLNDWAKANTKSALQTVYNAAADVFNAYNTLYVANGIRTQEGDNFTQGVIKGNQADALAQSDQALRDAFNAIRNGQPLPNNMVREIEITTEKQLLDTYDSLSANVSMSNNTEMVGMSDAHDKALRGRLEKLAGLFSGIKVLLGNKGTAGVAFTGGNTIAIQQGVADAMKAGIPIDRKSVV